MRPLEIRLADFRSYRGGPTTFDFRDRRLVGIVGPIGSGKSSLLDAIAFALYGKTPTVEKSTKSLIHQRADGATVALRFEVEGQVWEVVRALRRKGQSQHALYRYPEDRAGVEPVETIVQLDEVNSRIAELLGLEFDAFCRSVLLAQGRFAEFLSARPGERDKVLKGVFGHERVDVMRELARRKASDADARVRELAARIEHLDGIAAALAEDKLTVAELAEKLELAKKAQPRLVDVEERMVAVRAELDTTHRRLGELGTIAERLPALYSTERLLDEAAATARRRTEVGAAWEAAHGRLQAAEAKLVELDEAGTTAAVREAGELLRDRAHAASSLAAAKKRFALAAEREAHVAQSSAGAAERLRRAEAAAGDAEVAWAASVEALEAAHSSLHEAHASDMAATLRSGLDVGSPCPVCARQIDTLPPEIPAASLAAAQEVVDAAEAARRNAEAERAQAMAEVTAATEALEASEQQRVAAAEAHAAAGEEVTAAEAAIAVVEDRLADLLGAGDAERNLGRLRDGVESARKERADAAAAVARIRTDHDEAIRDDQETKRQLSELRDRLVEVAARLGVAPPATDGGPEILRSSIGGLRAEHSRAVEELSGVRSRAAAELEELGATLAEYYVELGVEGSFEAHLAALETRHQMLEDRIERATSELAASVEIVEERDRSQREAEIFTRLTTDLTDAKFVRWLLDEERSVLAELGSEHFQQLSSGRYRFSDDGRFDVVDLTAADAVRKSDSLSGGETFLASLGLAMALAEMVGRTGGRLDAFFLDEGFGTLDPEHLDLAMEGIEQLVAGDGNRLVVVVSHVPELRQRLEDLIHLDRDPVNGDTRVVRA